MNRDGFLRLIGSEQGSDGKAGWVIIKTSARSLLKAITGGGGAVLSGRCGKDGHVSFCCYHHHMMGQTVFSKDGDI